MWLLRCAESGPNTRVGEEPTETDISPSADNTSAALPCEAVVVVDWTFIALAFIIGTVFGQFKLCISLILTPRRLFRAGAVLLFSIIALVRQHDYVFKVKPASVQMQPVASPAQPIPYTDSSVSCFIPTDLICS